LAFAALPGHAAGQNYTWKNVKIGGSGYVPGIIAHPGQQGLFYARTDVGGTFRYNSATRTWTPLNDWPPASQFNISGIDAIAVDADDPNKLGHGQQADLREIAGCQVWR